MKKNTFKISSIITVMIIITMSLLFIELIPQNVPNLLRAGIILNGFLIEICLIFYIKSAKDYLLQFFLLIFGVINYLLIGNFSIYLLFKSVFITYPISIFLVFNKYNMKALKCFALIYILGIFIQLYRTFGQYSFFVNSSRNYVSVFLIFGLFLFIISDYEKYHKNTPVILSGIIFLGSILAVGRGGILATGFIFTFYYFFKIVGNKKISNYFYFLILLTGLVFIYLNFDFILYKYFSRFIIKDVTVLNSNSERLRIYGTYIRYCIENIKFLFFGVPESYIINLGVAHTHNSFLNFHSMYGLIPLLLFLVGLIKGIIHFMKNKNYTFLIFTMGFFIRAMIDVIFPSSLSEIILIYLVYYSLFYKNIKYYSQN